MIPAEWRTGWRYALADVVVARRTELGLTQDQTAVACRISSQTFRAIERVYGPDRRPSRATLTGLEHGLNWQQGSVDRFLRGQIEAPNVAIPTEGRRAPDLTVSTAIDLVAARDDSEAAAARLRSGIVRFLGVRDGQLSDPELLRRLDSHTTARRAGQVTRIGAAS